MAVPEVPKYGAVQVDRAFPIPVLDRVMVSLDPGAHRRVIESVLLPEQFGRFAIKGATGSTADGYGSVGLACRNTLVEFFHAAAPVLPGVTGGLCFSFQTAGSIGRARELLERDPEFSACYELICRAAPRETDLRPWYHLLRPDFGAHSPFTVFLGEVTPEYLAVLGVPRRPDGTLRRAAYLDAALGSPPAPEHRLRDITGVTVRLRPRRATVLAATLTTLGYAMESVRGQRILYGPAFELRIVVDDSAPEGVLSITVALTEPPLIGTAFRFGDTSRLEIAPDGRSAVWTFTPLAGVAAGTKT
ncbi:DUF5829 family protein [Nocardia sp. NPDC052566]|uniref:DUF5829 family protein n=1 Tax=Nocardia sp. NPDC052566 TaxID=3364330 RepID=UPI0037CAA3D6